MFKKCFFSFVVEVCFFKKPILCVSVYGCVLEIFFNGVEQIGVDEGSVPGIRTGDGGEVKMIK